MDAAGSPGISRISPKLIRLTMNNTGMALSSRRSATKIKVNRAP
jgi:hypothetical protein